MQIVLPKKLKNDLLIVITHDYSIQEVKNFYTLPINQPFMLPAVRPPTR